MTVDLYPTRTRMALLREVDAGECWQRPNGESVSCGLGREVRVTAAVAEAEQAGWVHVVAKRFGARQWQLTEDGRTVLDMHRED